MKIFLATQISMLLLYTGYAPANQQPIDISSNIDVNICISKFGENNDECLDKITKKSDETLNQAYEKKLKEIKSLDYTQWWMGNKEQKRVMITKFKSSQNIWINYRETFCQSATTSAQSTHNLGNAITACTLNMNARRIEEISLINPDIAD
ncbi:lysozyme inhibitor LprI family protein [Pantoea cypripedii]|nr:lysozyme inhibitor LprI family protein [Pantoea cypripedii]